MITNRIRAIALATLAAGAMMTTVAACDSATSDAAVKASHSTAQATSAKAAPKVDQSAQLRRYILDTHAGVSFTDYLSEDPTSWYGRISEVNYRNGNAHIRTTYGSDDKADAQQASKALASLIRMSNGRAPKVGWVIVENGVGTVLGQTKV